MSLSASAPPPLWAIGWDWLALAAALLHSLWQAGLTGLLLAAALRGLPACRSSLRALLSGLAQTAVLLAFLTTWAALGVPDRTDVAGPPADDDDAVAPPPAGAEAGWTIAPGSDAPLAPFVTSVASDPRGVGRDWALVVGIAWLVGATLMLVRIVADLAAGRALVRSGRPVEERLADQVRAIGRRLGLRFPVRPVWSDRVWVPAVYGLYRPVLLLPAAALRLPPENLEAILAHEVAHLKRCDWLWHLVGRVVEAVLFFNPAVWWIGRIALREREAAADALAHRPPDGVRAGARRLGRAAGRRRARAGLDRRPWRTTGPDPSRPQPRRAAASPPLPRRSRRRPPRGSGPPDRRLGRDAGRGRRRGGSPLAGRTDRAHRSRAREIARPEANEVNPPGERRQVTVSGTVRTADGRLLSEAGRKGYGTVSVKSHFKSGSGTSGGSWIGSIGPDGAFSVPIVDGEIIVTADWEGYAPASIGPLKPLPGADLKDVEVVLTRGFAGRVRLTGLDGEPITPATVEARLDEPASSQPRRYEAGKGGLVSIDLAAKHPYELTVTAPGYARETFKGVRLRPGEAVSLMLTPTESATGVVTDEHGEPIEGAVLRLFARWTPSMSHTYGTGPVLATADAEGRFVIDTLSKDERTAVLVEADGRGSEIRDIKPGEMGVTVRLAPERILRDEVVGDLSKLASRYVGGSAAEPSLAYSVVVTLFKDPAGPDQATSFGDVAAVVPDETSGDPPRRGAFELRDLLPGELTVRAGPAKRIFEPFDGLKEGVIIDLDEPTAGGPPRRKVVIRFVPPEPDAPPPTGDVRLDIKPIGEDADRRHEQFRRSVAEGRIETRPSPPAR